MKPLAAISGFLLVATLACTWSAAAESWARWRGPTGDGHVPANAWVPDSLPAEPKVAWRVKLGDGHGSPVVADGRVFILDKEGTDEVLHTLDAVTGQERWKKSIFLGADDVQGKGPRSTPLVDGDRVYVQTMRGEFQCLHAATGELRWRKNFVDDFGAIFIGEKPNPKAIGASRHGNNGSPVIDGDHIVVQAGGLEGASVVCLNKHTGDVVWKSQNDQSGYAAAVIATLAGERQVVAFTAIGVIGLDVKDGRLRWRVPISTTWARHATTPTIVGDTVVVSSHEHGLYGFRITREGDAMTGTEAWLTKEAAINFSSPVAVGDHLYGLGPTKNLICVEVRTGRRVWSQDIFVAGGAGNAHAAFLVMGRNILALTDRGELILFAADPAGFREVPPVAATEKSGARVARAQVCGKTWCNPAYVDGQLFLRDNKEVLCVSLK